MYDFRGKYPKYENRLCNSGMRSLLASTFQLTAGNCPKRQQRFLNAFKGAYQSQVLANARAFAKACAAHGIPVEGGEAEGYTRTHQVILRVSSFGDAKEIASRLEANNIVTNYQALPGDETFYHPSGIRMGVQEMTRFGMKERDFDGLARFIAEVVLRKKNIASDVAEFRSNFLTMGYCLNAEQTIRLGVGIFESMMPKAIHSSLFPKP